MKSRKRKVKIDTTKNTRNKIIAQKMERNYINGFQQLSGINGATFHSDETIAEFVSGYEVGWMNNVFRIDGDARGLSQQISDTLKRYTDKHYPMVWRVGSLTEQPKRVIKLLEKHGFDFVGSSAAMILETKIGSESPALPELRIELVQREAQVRDWLIPFCHAFELSAPISSHFEQWIHRRLGLTSSEVWFVGYANNEPACSASYFVDSEITVIYNVATMTHFRGRGYARRILEMAIRHALNNSAFPIALYATEMGYPLYKSMGFAHVYKMKNFEPTSNYKLAEVIVT
jgi:GNAT superfamily N-acetyltransferase